MTEQRTTQQAVEVLVEPDPKLRVTQQAIEVATENRQEHAASDTGVGTDDASIALAVAESGVGSEVGTVLKADTIVSQPFKIGVVETRLEQPFAILEPPLTARLSQPFAISGPLGSRLAQPFAITGMVSTRLAQPFGIQSVLASPSLGYWSPGTPGTTTTPGTPATFTPGIRVFDKAGNPLGTISAVTVNGARERAISESGSMQFYVPRDDPASLALVREDRLVAVTNQLGMATWAGTIETKRWDMGALQVNAPDVSALLASIEVELKMEVTPGTPVATIVRRLVALLNNARAARGVDELQWSVRVNGSPTGTMSRTWRGDADLSGYVVDLLSRIAERHDVEWHWGAAIGSDGKLQVWVDLSDEFDGGAGAPIFDGPGGNVVSTPAVVFDPAAMIHGLRVVGQRTNIAQYAAPWARWAVHEVQPQAFAARDPGDYRYREDLEVTVDWSLPKELQIQKARETEAKLWQLYGTFLTAFHDQFGRPFHEGFKYQGPPAPLEQFLFTGLGWRTWLKLVEVKRQPGSAVMISRPEMQALIVTYPVYDPDPEQLVRRYWFSELEGEIYVTRMHVHGWTYRYRVEGGVIVERRTSVYDHSTAVVSETTVTVPWPREVNGVQVVTYHQLRRVTSLIGDITGVFEGGPAQHSSEGWYFEPSAGAWGPTDGVFWDDDTPIFTRPVVGDPPWMYFTQVRADHGVELDSSFLSKMYEFERRRIADWDPRRDGIGIWKSKPTIVNNQPSTAYRWHVVPFGEGGDFTTDLQFGISATATKIYVGNAMQVPATLPFYVTVDPDRPGMEVMRVDKVLGDEFTVVRGQMGTTAVPHEQGARVVYDAPEDWDGFELPPYNWPEGDAYAQDLVDKLSRPMARVDLSISNEDGSWSTVRVGSRHLIDLNTEGPLPGGIHGEARVVGFAPDEHAGRMRLVLDFEVE